jgi:hypothetical protein
MVVSYYDTALLFVSPSRQCLDKEKNCPAVLNFGISGINNIKFIQYEFCTAVKAIEIQTIKIRTRKIKISHHLEHAVCLLLVQTMLLDERVLAVENIVHLTMGSFSHQLEFLLQIHQGLSIVLLVETLELSL